VERGHVSWMNSSRVAFSLDDARQSGNQMIAIGPSRARAASESPCSSIRDRPRFRNDHGSRGCASSRVDEALEAAGWLVGRCRTVEIVKPSIDA